MESLLSTKTSQVVLFIFTTKYGKYNQEVKWIVGANSNDAIKQYKALLFWLKSFGKDLEREHRQAFMKMYCQAVFTCDAKGITGCQGRWRGLFIFSFGNITQPGCYYHWTNIEKFCTNIYTLLIKYWKDSQILCWMSINIVYNLSFGNNTQTGCY